jgi:hypothetical protein
MFGLECDKMNPEAVALHLDHVIGEMKKHLGEQVGRGLKFVLLDSYEAGNPTWTPNMREEFKSRRGYDPLPFLPDAMKAELTAASRTGAYPAKYENFEKALIYHLRTVSDTDTAEGGHGAIGRLKNAADKAENVKDLFEYASSSVYTDAKLRRALLFSVLRIRKEDLHKTPSYTQLLAANKRGLSVLAAERKDPKITVVTKPADHADVFGAERRADELYCMLTPKTLQKGEYMKKSPYIKEENE